MNINIVEAMLILFQLHARTCARSSHSKHSKEDTILSYYITTILISMLAHKVNHYKLLVLLIMAWVTIISNSHCKHVSFIIGWIRNDELIIFTKTGQVEFIPASLISISPSYIVIIAFHLHDRTVWIIIIVHVHSTKQESANVYSEEKTR